VTEGDTFWEDPEKETSLSHVNYLHCVQQMDRNSAPRLLDLSRGENLIYLCLETCFPIKRLIWPLNPANLEILCCTEFDEKNMGPLFPPGVVFSHLQSMQMTFPRGIVTTISSECFPKLEALQSSTSIMDGLLDLSTFRTPGLVIFPGFCSCNIKLAPDIPLGELMITCRSLRVANIREALPTAKRLRLTFCSSDELDAVFSLLNGTSAEVDRPLTSPHLQHLQLPDMKSQNIRLGDFSALRTLELKDGNSTLDGKCFPCLEVLKICRGKKTLTGHFQALWSLAMRGNIIAADFELSAPHLQMVSFDSVRNANLVFIGRGRYPALQKVIVKPFPAGSSFGSTRSSIPELVPDEKVDPPRLISLHLDAATPTSIIAEMESRLPNWSMHLFDYKELF